MTFKVNPDPRELKHTPSRQFWRNGRLGVTVSFSLRISCFVEFY